MFWSKGLLPDPKRGLKERPGFAVFAHVHVQLGQIIEARRRIGMIWPTRLLENLKRFLKERLGLGVVSDLFVKASEVIQGSGGLGIRRTSSALCEIKRSFRNWNRLLILSFRKQTGGSLIELREILILCKARSGQRNPDAEC